MRKSGAAGSDCETKRPPEAFPLEGKVGGFSRSDEARNPPLPVADQGGCSANEATSFASVSVAKRLCRIVRVVAATAALPFNRCDNDHCVVYTSPPPTAEPLLKEKPLGGCTLQLSPIAAQVFLHPTIAPWQRTAQLDAGLAKPDRRGKAEANGGKLAFIRAVQAFTCHGAMVGCENQAR